MRNKLFWSIAAVFITAFVSLPTFADAQEYPEWYSWTYDEGIYLMHDVDHHFYLAREDFERKDMGGAAEQILTAADYMKLEAQRAGTAEEKEALDSSIRELEELANGVVTGKVTSVKELEDVFAHANHVIATHQFWKASVAFKRNEPEKAANALKSSAFHLERSMAWSGTSKAKPAAETPKKQSSVERRLAVNDRVSANLAVDLVRHLDQAQTDFGEKDFQAADEQMRTSIAFLRLEATRMGSEEKKALTDSVSELEKLAEETAKGAANVSSAQLESAFARAELVLAKSNYRTALEAFRKKETQKTGYALLAATALLKNAGVLLGQDQQHSVAALAGAAEPVAKKLVKGGEAPPAEVDKIIMEGTQAAEKLGKAGAAKK